MNNKQNKQTMKRIFYKSLIVLASAVALPMSSCSDYLAVSDQLASELTMDEVFSNVSYTKRFHAYIYSGMEDLTFICIDPSYRSMNGMDNPWSSLCDELKAGQGDPRQVPVTGYNAGNANFSRWHLYAQIRQAIQFQKFAKEIPQKGETDYISQEEIDKMKAQARFFVAFYHWKLFELYGPVPLRDYEADPNNPAHLDVDRASMDEMIAFLDKEFKEVAEQLQVTEPENTRAVPTKGVALALRAKMWLFAASPLYNGGNGNAWSIEARSKKNSAGKDIFPAYDATKWDKAKAAFDDFMVFAESANGYKIHKENLDGVFSPDESLYQVFKKHNKEIIWAASKNSLGNCNSEGTYARMTPRPIYAMPSIGVLQALVDDFYMVDGLKIEDSPLYDKANEFTMVDYEQVMWNRNTDPNRADLKRFTDKVAKAFTNREPRFYRAVFFQGRRWQIENRPLRMEKDSFKNLQGNDQLPTYNKYVFADNASDNQPWSGYLYHKFYDQSLYPNGPSPRGKFQPTIYLRFAEMLLIGAEIYNEAGADKTKIYEWIDAVRERAGIPLLRDIKPNLDQAGLRKAIRDERRVEFVGEGQRYFDVRRWMIHDQPGDEQFGKTYGLNMHSTDPGAGFHTRVSFEDRIWMPGFYLYPLPLNEILKSKKLVQNPGW